MRREPTGLSSTEAAGDAQDRPQRCAGPGTSSLCTKYPPGRGPKVDLFGAADPQKAVDTIKQRVGPHLQVTELLINMDHVDVTAQDPKDSRNFAIFTYKDEDVTRDDDLRDHQECTGSDPERVITGAPE